MRATPAIVDGQKERRAAGAAGDVTDETPERRPGVMGAPPTKAESTGMTMPTLRCALSGANAALLVAASSAQKATSEALIACAPFG